MISTCMYPGVLDIPQDCIDTVPEPVLGEELKFRVLIVFFLDDILFLEYECTYDEMVKVLRYHDLMCGQADNPYDKEMWEFFYTEEGDLNKYLKRVKGPIRYCVEYDAIMVSGMM